MEKDANTARDIPCKAYACFQELETLSLLNFLQVSEGKVTYKGAPEDQGRKHKHFGFESVSFLTQKLRHINTPIIDQSVKELLEGKDGTLLILGNEQSKKEKILIGQSQNQGFLLQFLSTLFDVCFEKEIDDRVTIKLSCWQQREGKIGDLIGGTGCRNAMSNWIYSDLVEGNVVAGIPEIIIRNMKSALKIIRIFMKSLEMHREQAQQTQNLVFTIKLQIDNEYDKLGKVTEYQLSKFHIVKLSHPYTTKAPSKHTSWFVNLFNYMQAHTLEKNISAENTNTDDEFSTYLRDNLVKSASSVHCLSIFSNKMNANDCLTSLKFTSYLQHLKPEPRKNILNIDELFSQKNALEGELITSFNQEKEWTKNICTWLPSQIKMNCLDLELIVANHFHSMQAHNILQYEYAVLLTNGCDRLQKYIYSEQVQDFYYAKKVVLDPSEQLNTALYRFLDMQKRSKELEAKYVRKLGTLLARVKKEAGQSRQGKYLINSRTKIKNLFEKLFQLYGTLSIHFLYDKNPDFVKELMPNVQSCQQSPFRQTPINIEQIRRSLDEKEEHENSQAAIQTKKEVKKKKFVPVDETEMMFMNTNVSFCTKRKRA